MVSFEDLKDYLSGRWNCENSNSSLDHLTFYKKNLSLAGLRLKELARTDIRQE